MESDVAARLAKLGWEAEQGVYYSDISTGKPREIDVYCMKVFTGRAGREHGIINLELTLECKSLSGSNILFSSGRTREFGFDECHRYWIGDERDVRFIVSSFLDAYEIKDPRVWSAVYDYALDRAYPFGGRALRHPVKFPPPPVDMIAHAFRETKGGAVSDRSSEAKGANPLWNAILSSFSFLDSAMNESRESGLSWTRREDYRFRSISDSIKTISFFLDMELLRVSFFHPIVVVDAPLWRLEGDSVDRVQSVRIHINELRGFGRYVDVVSYDGIEIYIDGMTRHFKKSARSSLSRLKKEIEEIEYYPGEREADLLKALGISRRRKVSPA